MTKEKHIELVCDKIISILNKEYTSNRGFASAYVITDLDLGIISEYNFIRSNYDLMVPIIDKAITTTSGMKHHVIFSFTNEDGAETNDITLNIVGIEKQIVNLKELETIFKGSTIKLAVEQNRQFCIPLFFAENVNLNKAFKWIKYKLSKMLMSDDIRGFVDYTSSTGTVKSMYLVRKGESPALIIYRDIINRIYAGELSFSINVDASHEPLSKYDLEDMLDKEFGHSCINVDVFDSISELSKYRTTKLISGKIKYIIEIKNPITPEYMVKLKTIDQTYDSIIKPSLADIGRYVDFLILEYELSERNENFLSVIDSLIKKEIHNKELLRVITVDWLDRENINNALALYINSK